MEKKNLSKLQLGILILLGLAVGIFLPGLMEGKAEMTVDGTVYTMRDTTLREFMEGGYKLALVTITDGGEVMYHNYAQAQLEAKTEYNSGVALRSDQGKNAEVNAWLYNPTSKPVGIRDGVLYGLSYDLRHTQDSGITVSVAGLELGPELTRAEIYDWMDQHLKHFQRTENEDQNAASYRKGGRVSYTFKFTEEDTLQTVSVFHHS